MGGKTDRKTTDRLADNKGWIKPPVNVSKIHPTDPGSISKRANRPLADEQVTSVANPPNGARPDPMAELPTVQVKMVLQNSSLTRRRRRELFRVTTRSGNAMSNE